MIPQCLDAPRRTDHQSPSQPNAASIPSANPQPATYPAGPIPIVMISRISGRSLAWEIEGFPIDIANPPFGQEVDQGRHIDALPVGKLYTFRSPIRRGNNKPSQINGLLSGSGLAQLQVASILMAQLMRRTSYETTFSRRHYGRPARDC